MSTRLVARRPHAAFRWDHLVQVVQVGGGKGLARYFGILFRPRLKWRQDVPHGIEIARLLVSPVMLRTEVSDTLYRHACAELYPVSGAFGVL